MLSSNWFENPACKGCEYGERVTSGVFCAMTQDLVPIGYMGCKAQNDFYEKQYQEEKGMTLKEVANELRKVFEFSWLTYDRRGDDWYVLNLWKRKPVYENGMWCPEMDAESYYPQSIDRKSLRSDITLDLSEYPSMPITCLPDYSKCIVEVE